VIRFTLSRVWPQGALAAGLLALIAVALAVTGAHLYRLWDATMAPCLAAHPALARYGFGSACTADFLTLRAAYAPYGWVRAAAGIAVLMVPALIGLFWGAPLIGSDLAEGTWRLAWTQSITRTHWVAVKVAVVGAASIAVAGLLSWLVTWWAGPLDQLASLNGGPNSGQFSPLLFSERGLVPVGYAAFAFALGAAAGTVLRRTVPAMVLTLAALAGARLAATFWLRTHLEPAAHLALPLKPFLNVILIAPTTTPTGSWTAFSTQFLAPPPGPGDRYLDVARPPNVQNAWVLSDHVVTPAGHPAAASAYAACFASTRRLGAHSPSARNACLARWAVHSRYHQLVTLQPAGRYWLFQAYETAIFAAAALLLAGACLWWVRRRLT
jgi:hypothetical protein